MRVDPWALAIHSATPLAPEPGMPGQQQAVAVVDVSGNIQETYGKQGKPTKFGCKPSKTGGFVVFIW